MGVIRNINTVRSPYESNFEDILDEIVNGDHADDDMPNARSRPRRSRRHRQGQQPLRPEHTMPPHFLAHRHRSGKKFQRLQNTTFLMSLTDNGPDQEVTIEDFMTSTESVFSQLIREMESMEAWNAFINQGLDGTIPGEAIESVGAAETDKRSQFPAYTPEACFRKIDSSLRSLLRHQHVPLGKLSMLEAQLLEFFQSFPDQVFKSVQPSSYERLLLHALSQYLDLCSQSYNEEGQRWTKVQNPQTQFILPAVMLSVYLENRFRANS